MRLLHTADLHIGKTVNDFSMLEDQKYILEQIKNIALYNEVDGVVIAGDIYDRAIPAGEAVMLLNDFLTELSKKGIAVYLISGNHDSPERISFGENLLANQRVFIGGVYRGKLPVFQAEDKWGTVEIVLLPFVRPAQADARTSEEAVAKLLQGYFEEEKKEKNTKEKKRRVLVTHYFVTDAGREPELSDSETTIHVGGLDNVEASLFKDFDYVALGHIHKPQKIGDKPVYYSGSPLKYSFGEVNQTKSVLLIELTKEGLSGVEPIPLKPLREMRKVKGSLEEIMERVVNDGAGREDYIQAVLTNQEELIDPIGTLRSVYPNIMQIVREEKKEKTSVTAGSFTVGKREPEALFEEFYETVRGEKLADKGKELIEEVVKKLEGGL
ncbi:MAG: exonuclease SbcCD subunit D [Lachnospiraceae bacterium]|nr:exonuclease SbcCD subunit D [Lachnospiraceae bacterium]